MARRLGQRDITWLSVLAGLFLLLAVLVLYGAQGYDHPFSNVFLKILGIPGTSLGWGSVALVLLAIPYALLAWLRGPIPAKAVSLLGALVFALGVGGLSGALSEPAFAGGGRLAGTLAQMLKDVLGVGMGAVLMGAIAVPGLFLALAPLVIEATKSAAARAASGGAAGAEAPSGAGPSIVIPPAPPGASKPAAGALPPRVAPGRTTPPPVPVKAKPWYPERRVAADGTELPMQLPGADVGPIRYRDEPAPPPKPAPNAIVTAPPAGVKKDKPIAGIRYVDEAPPEAPPKVAELDVPAEDELAEGVRFAPRAERPPPAPPSHEPPIEATFEPALAPTVDPAAAVSMDALPTPVDVAPPPPATEIPAVEVPPVAPAAAVTPVGGPELATPAPAAPPAPEPSALPGVRVEIPAPSSKAAGALGLDGPALDGPSAAAVAEATAPQPTAAPGAPALHPSVVSHRRKLAESGIVGANPAADRPGRAPKPKPRPAPPTADFREALRGLFSSLPVEELPPMRVSEPLEPELPPEPRTIADSPGQLRLFDPGTPEPGERHPGLDDPLFGASVEAALERGSASLVLLKRKLGVGYARAATLMDALVSEGILGEMTASGSRPTLLTPGEWARRKRS